MARYKVLLAADDFRKKHPEIFAELYEGKERLSSVVLTLDTGKEHEIEIDGDEFIGEILIELALSFKDKIVELAEGY